MNPRLASAPALNASQARHRSLWCGLVGAWFPAFASMHRGRALDYSGFANHGTLTNGPTWGAGKYGRGLTYDGIDDCVIGDTSGQQFPLGGDTRSIAMWIKSASWSGDTCLFHWGTDGASPAEANCHLVAGSSGVILWGNGYSGHLTTGTGVSVRDGKWHHIVGTYNGVNGVIWIDGRFVASQAWTPATLSGNLWRMGLFMSNGGPWTGTMSEVLLYRRVLTVSEIVRLAAGSSPFDPAKPVRWGKARPVGYTFASGSA